MVNMIGSKTQIFNSKNRHLMKELKNRMKNFDFSLYDTTLTRKQETRKLKDLISRNDKASCKHGVKIPIDTMILSRAINETASQHNEETSIAFS